MRSVKAMVVTALELVLATSVSVSTGCGGPAADPVLVDAAVITPLTSAAVGHRRAVEYLRAVSSRGPLQDAARLASASVVRVRCKRSVGGHETTSSGTGFIVGDGRYVVTACHVIGVASDQGGVSVEVGDGREFAATAVGRGSWHDGSDPDDWVLLHVDDETAKLPPALELGAAGKEVEVVLLGFGADAGLDTDGRVVTNAAGVSLAPTWFVGRAADAAGLRIDPVAGCLPERGFSGGPVVEAGGSVVAIAVGTDCSDITLGNDGHGAVLRRREYAVRAVPVAAVMQLLGSVGTPR